MPINIDPRMLAPDYAGAFARGAEQANVLKSQRLGNQQIQQQMDATQAQQQAQQLGGGIISGQLPSGMNQQEALGKVYASNPDLAIKTLKTLGVKNQADADEFASFAYTVQNTPIEQRGPLIQSRVEQLASQGRDPSKLQSLVDMNTEQQEQVLTGIQMAALSAKERLEQQKGGKGGFTLAAGQQRFDAQGNMIATGPETPVKLSSLQQKVQAEGIDPFSKDGFKRAKEINLGARTDPSLKLTEQQVLSKASEGQLASAGFANRVNAANKVFSDLEKVEGFDPTSMSQAALGAIPLGNLVLSSETQQFTQAKRDFITAVLRKESGAAIGVDEFANEEKKYFPQIGDKPEVIAAKKKGRERAFDNLKKQSKGVFDVQFAEETAEFNEGQTATGPGGQRIVLKNGQWVGM